MDLHPTFRQVNEPYLILGLFDWRYVAVASLPALFAGLLGHSKLVFCLAFLFFQWLAWRIYSVDPKAPKAWLYTIRDKSHFCPFRAEGDK